jgi:hypothetical protein
MRAAFHLPPEEGACATPMIGQRKTGRSLRAPGTRCRYDEIYNAFDQTRQALLFVHRTFRVFSTDSAENSTVAWCVKIDAALAVRDAVSVR